MTKRDENASDNLLAQAAAKPQDELVAGLPGQPESIQTQTLLAPVLERANLQRALKQVRQNKGAPGIDGMTVDELGTGTARPPLCPVRRRLQYSRQKQTGRRAGDGQRDTLCK